MEEFDMMAFVGDDEVAAGIAEDTQEVTDEAFDKDEGDQAETDVTAGDEEEADEQEEEVEEAEEQDDTEAPPEKTGNRETDGKAKALWAAREKQRKLREENEQLARQLAFLQGKLETTPQQQAQKQEQQEVEEELPEFDYADLETSVEQRFRILRQKELLREQQQRAQEEAARWQKVINASTREAKEEYSDYEEVEGAFIARMKTQEGAHLKEILIRQADPAAWAYKNQKAYEKRATRKSPEVEALEARIAELESLTKRGKKPQGRRTIAGARGAGAKPSAKTDPLSADDVFFSAFSKK